MRNRLNRNKRAIDRRWEEYPVGTLANAVMGGYWEKTNRGWKWCTGSTFPNPGGDAISVSIPYEDFIDQYPATEGNAAPEQPAKEAQP